ncbi:MAG: hypothetical protein U0670_24220 [Anaerolineae bacterium]
MSSKRNIRGMVLALVLALALVLPIAVNAQTDSSSRTQCDSTLILLAGLAQRYFGFTSISGLDMTQFEYGQYSPFWSMSDPSMSGGSSTGMTSGDTAGGTTSSTGNTTGDTTAQTPVPTMSGDTTGGTGTMTFLNPPMIADENTSCMQLRAELEAFFTSGLANPNWDQSFRGGMGGSMGMGGTTGSTSGSTSGDSSGTTSGSTDNSMATPTSSG